MRALVMIRENDFVMGVFAVADGMDAIDLIPAMKRRVKQLHKIHESERLEGFNISDGPTGTDGYYTVNGCKIKFYLQTTEIL